MNRPGSPSVIFTLDGIRRGFVVAQPLTVGVFAYAVTFGLLARDVGLSILEATLMSGTVFAGSAQVATVSAVAAGGSILASVVTAIMLNARYLLFGASLRPWLGQTTPRQAYATLFFLGDINWLMSLKARADGEADAGFIFGSGFAMYMPWVAGTLLGAVAGDFIAHPEQLALDFLLVAFCMAMAVGLFKSRADISIVGVALVAALAADWLAPSPWTMVIAGVAGAAMGYARHVEAKA